MTNKEVFVETMEKVRAAEIEGLEMKIQKAQDEGDSKVCISIHDAYFMLTALLHHFDAEKGFIEEDTDK